MTELYPRLHPRELTAVITLVARPFTPPHPLICFFCNEPATVRVSDDPLCTAHGQAHLSDIISHLLSFPVKANEYE